MRAIVTVARASLLEHSRRKLLAFFVVASMLFTVLALYVLRDATTQALFGTGRGVLIGIALGFFHFLVLLAALAVSMGNIGAAFASGEATVVLARPVTRWQYALGRVSASILAVAGLCTLLAVLTNLVQVFGATELVLPLWGHWAVMAFNFSVIVAVTSLCSVFVRTPILAAVVGFFAYQLLNGIGTFYRIVQMEGIAGPFATTVRTLWYATPKFLTSPVRTGPGALDERFVVTNSPGLMVWAVAYLAGLVALTLLLTSRKDVA